MAESRRYVANQQLDITQILAEAQNRWLRPNEVCEILRNYQKFYLTPDPPNKPPGGSLFLFDRKALRYFRKDGHSWRKKKDGKTVREAHEKLKAGSVDVLHCYYAHGEDNENFQRRSYWMLDTQLEHIVLVHYREVKEGSKSGTPRLLQADPGVSTGSAQIFSTPLSARADSPAVILQSSYASSPSTADWNGQTPSSELEDVESGDDLGTSSHAENIPSSGCENASVYMHNAAGKSGHLSSSRIPLERRFDGAPSIQFPGTSVWSELHIPSGNIGSVQENFTFYDRQNGTEAIARKSTESKLDVCNLLKDDISVGNLVFPDMHLQTSVSQGLVQEQWKDENGAQVDYSDNYLLSRGNDAFQFPKEPSFHFVHQPFQENAESHLPTASGKIASDSYPHYNESGKLKKLDSFGRWMNTEIGGDGDDSLMASDSGNYWNTLDTQNEDKEVSSLSNQMQLDVGSLGPSLSQEQLFSIGDFSPEWAYSGVETKILISGKFLGDLKRLSTTEWCCMFGEIEVPAEVLTDSVLRCQAPQHTTGRVPFYITCSNRLACSEVREFEYREKPSNETLSMAVKSEPDDEMRLQIRLAKLLCMRFDKKWLDCSVEQCDRCNIKNKISSMLDNDGKDWGQIEQGSGALEKKTENVRDLLIQKLLKDRMYEWLVCKIHEEGKGSRVLDDEGQGIIHLAAALGYEWAMCPIVAAGVSPNYRDVHGRTGLHWAAYFGREEATVTLVRLGAAPGAVDDPTPKFPGGQTAADLASSRGHKGIAGYLAEADLTSHLSSLTVNESVIDSVAATIAAEKAVESVEERNVLSSEGGRNGESTMKGSLAAVRQSAQAAAHIQAAFRARSFKHRQLTQNNEEISENSTDLIALSYLNKKTQRTSHFGDYLHTAAIKIQQKYRGWKGRTEFLKIRNRIVKLQAHVRGHQVRKQYKKVVWSVSIVEKAILRWRRKRTGLRGFRADNAISKPQPENGKIDDYEFLRLGRKQKVAGVEKALARVQSMVRYPEARDQYMRLVTSFQNSKKDGEGSRSQS